MSAPGVDASCPECGDEVTSDAPDGLYHDGQRLACESCGTVVQVSYDGETDGWLNAVEDP